MEERRSDEDVVFTQGHRGEYVFFCKISGPNPWFSNWYPSRFRLNGKEFGCVEQYMMWQKARLMGDAATACKILATTAPSSMKALGRQVKNFDEQLWARERENVVYAACLAKFQQDEVLGRKLRATQGATIVEAAPYDCIWGIGLARNDARALDEKRWLGLNLLGKALMRVRIQLA
jgi:ribA/ribD-fused uncharacterized protein